MADKKTTYRERAANTVMDELTPEQIFINPEAPALFKKDKERLKKTRPDWFTDGKHSQESIMRGIEEGEVAEKGMVGKALNRLKTNVMGSAVDNELAAEQEAERARKNPAGNEAKFRKIMGKKKGGSVGYKSGGSVSSASKRGDGCAIKGKTRGRMV
jgi:hypothetical protein